MPLNALYDIITTKFFSQNGHVSNNTPDGITFGNYVDHTTQGTLRTQQASSTTFPLVPSTNSCYPLTTSSSIYPLTTTSSSTLPSTVHHLAGLYSGYSDYDTEVGIHTDNLDTSNLQHHSRVGEGIKLNGLSETIHKNSGAFSPSFPNSYTASSSSFKSPTSTNTLPLPLQLNSVRNSSTIGIPTSTSSPSTIPRLGIPVDPSQYIVPPRTQVMQGALATHV